MYIERMGKITMGAEVRVSLWKGGEGPGQTDRKRSVSYGYTDKARVVGKSPYVPDQRRPPVWGILQSPEGLVTEGGWSYIEKEKSGNGQPECRLHSLNRIDDDRVVDREHRRGHRFRVLYIVPKFRVSHSEYRSQQNGDVQRLILGGSKRLV